MVRQIAWVSMILFHTDELFWSLQEFEELFSVFDVVLAVLDLRFKYIVQATFFS